MDTGVFGMGFVLVILSLITVVNIHPLQNPVYLENRQLLFFGTAISFSILLFLPIISYYKPWGKRKMLQDDTP
jgi:Na+-transporting methylmalonyl-CoA/oxaloacetate decarboxylase gamma subunit